MTKWKRQLLLASLLLLLTFLASWFYRETERVLSTNINFWTDDHRADCAVVLTGGPGRIREGFSLLSQTRVKKLIISGVYAQATLREIFPEWPFYGPINEADVVLEKRSSTTYGNAQQSLPLVEAMSCKSIVLITSRIHMYRALRIFQSVFPADLMITARSISYGPIEPSIDDLALETVKSLFYSIWAYD